MKQTFALTLLAGSVLLSSQPVAQAKDRIDVAGKQTVSIEQLFSGAKYGRPVLSPNGKFMAVTSPQNGREALMLYDIEKRDMRKLISSKDWDVVNPIWVNNNRLLFQVNDSKVAMADNKGGGLFAVDIDGSAYRTLSKTWLKAESDGDFAFRPYTYDGRVGDDSDEIYVLHNERNGSGSEANFGGVDVYRMDTKTGKTKLLTFDSPGKVNSWVLDHAGQVRIGISLRNDNASKELKYYVYYRENNDSPWNKIGEYPYDKAFLPVEFDIDNKTMYVVGRSDEDTTGLYTWDFAKNQPKELLLRHPRADFGGLLHDPATDRVVGAVINGLKPEQYYFDQEYADLQASIDAALPGAYNTLQRRGGRAVVVSRSDVNPGEALLYDESKKTLEELFQFKPEIKPAQMSPMQALDYTARDGLTIPAYLTLPKGRTEKNLPLVVFVHGGPHSRDRWGFDPYVQHLASRGYAVLQPQFRMSTGFGWQLHHAGWKQWGLAMQDDVTDGVNWLVKQGKVDPKRVCIMGASYGGYATMYGLEKDPDLYQCGVNFVGVTDVSMLFSVAWSDTSGSAWSKYKQRDMHGDPDKDADYMRKASALSDDNVARLKAPVLMAYGSEDVRVPLVHGEKMRDKLLKKGNTVEWMVFIGEGHGWAKPENRYKWAHAYEDFINTYIGDKAQLAGK